MNGHTVSSVEAPPEAGVRHAGPCAELKQTLGPKQAVWSQADWVRYAACLDQRDQSERVIETANRGLERYPSSGALYNMKAYHQIVRDDHAEAVDTLRTARERSGASYDGVLENNLAWAGLWARRDMSLDRARGLYREAIERSQGVCAYVHTGLWVEYAIAEDERGVERFRALKNFRQLRDQYEPCLSRLEQGDWETVVEITGAGVMFDELASEDSQRTSDQSQGASGQAILRRAVRTLESKFPSKSVDDVCRDAMPLESSHHECTERLRSVAKSATIRRPAESSSASTEDTSGGGSGCPARMK